MRKTLAATVAAIALIFGLMPAAVAVAAPCDPENGSCPSDDESCELAAENPCTLPCSVENPPFVLASAYYAERAAWAKTVAAQAKKLERKQAKIERLKKKIRALR